MQQQHDLDMVHSQQPVHQEDIERRREEERGDLGEQPN